MESPSARDTLLVRYYKWSLRQWDVELARDLSALRGLRAHAAERFLGALERLGREQAGAVAVALTKRFHPDAARLLGEELSAREDGLLADLDTYRHLWGNSNPTKMGMPVGQRRGLLPRVRDRLKELGQPATMGPLEWRYELRIGSWTLQTYVDFGGRHGDLTYDHRLFADSDLGLPGFISVLSWLGISNTKWRIVDESDADFATGRIAALSLEFINAVPELTTGLIPGS